MKESDSFPLNKFISISVFTGNVDQGSNLDVFVSNDSMEGKYIIGKSMPGLVSTSLPNGGISEFLSSEIIQFLELSRNGSVMTICKVKLYEAGKCINDYSNDVLKILNTYYVYYLCYNCFYYYRDYYF